MQLQTAHKWVECLDSWEQALTFFFPVIFHSFRTWVALPIERKDKTFQQKFGYKKEQVCSTMLSHLLAGQHFHLWLGILLCGQNKAGAATFLLPSYSFWLITLCTVDGLPGTATSYGLHSTKWLNGCLTWSISISLSKVSTRISCLKREAPQLASINTS